MEEKHKNDRWNKSALQGTGLADFTSFFSLRIFDGGLNISIHEIETTWDKDWHNENTELKIMGVFHFKFTEV